jgi:hypothetical protein
MHHSPYHFTLSFIAVHSQVLPCTSHCLSWIQVNITLSLVIRIHSKGHSRSAFFYVADSMDLWRLEGFAGHDALSDAQWIKTVDMHTTGEVEHSQPPISGFRPFGTHVRPSLPGSSCKDTHHLKVRHCYRSGHMLDSITIISDDGRLLY